MLQGHYIYIYSDLTGNEEKPFSTVAEEGLWSKPQVQSNKAFEYLVMILITQWWNTQWVVTRKE